MKAVAGLPLPDWDCNEWREHPPLLALQCIRGDLDHQTLLPPRLQNNAQNCPPLAPSRTTALAVPTAEEPSGVVLVLRVEDTAEELPEALALDQPDGRLTLATVVREAS